MSDFPVEQFESLVREFLAGKKQWDDVHDFVIGCEWIGAATLPHDCPSALEDLRSAFLADSRDDRQFLLTKAEAQELLDKL